MTEQEATPKNFARQGYAFFMDVSNSYASSPTAQTAAFVLKCREQGLDPVICYDDFLADRNLLTRAGVGATNAHRALATGVITEVTLGAEDVEEVVRGERDLTYKYGLLADDELRQITTAFRPRREDPTIQSKLSDLSDHLLQKALERFVAKQSEIFH